MHSIGPVHHAESVESKEKRDFIIQALQIEVNFN